MFRLSASPRGWPRIFSASNTISRVTAWSIRFSSKGACVGGQHRIVRADYDRGEVGVEGAGPQDQVQPLKGQSRTPVVISSGSTLR